jgi:transcriptional regulator with XRE-family HTH domain
MKSKPPRLPKMFFATLLGLREVMTQNAERIFGKECLNQALEDDDEGTTGAKSSPRKARIIKEEKQYCARSLATAVTIAAIERSQSGDTNKTIEEFLKVAQAYDDGDSEFSSCLEEDQGNIHGVLPNGQRLNAEEEVARNVSFNRARKLHPIVQRDMERRMKIRSKRLIHVPEPSACHITMVEIKSDLTQYARS